jgi:hypothetical protein
VANRGPLFDSGGSQASAICSSRHHGAVLFCVCRSRPFLSQHDRTAPIMAHDVERVLADIGDCAVEFLRHGVLLDFGAPGASFACWRGQEHGRTIPLAVTWHSRDLAIDP